MELRYINDNVTELKVSNKKFESLIEQLKFIGAVVHKESTLYTYFRFNGDIPTTQRILGIR